MSETNLYAPPKADKVAAETGAMWREGKILVMRPDAAFPHRCIKCNAPAEAPLRERKLYWHSPWLYLLVLFNIFIYAIVAMIVRKRATIEIPLCAQHQKRIFWRRVIGWGGLVLFIGLMVTANKAHQSEVLLMAVGLALIWLIAFAAVGIRIWPQRMDAEFLRLKGCSPEFLASLPDFSQRWQGSAMHAPQSGAVPAAPSQQFPQLKR